jgi:anti-sigma regulatory factor (Ser/Thr protein kinase)
MRLDVDPRNIAVARRFVGSAMDGLVPEPVIADLVLATSELVTNAFEHGPSPVVVSVTVASEQATVRVRTVDGGTWADVPHVERWEPAPPDRISGRGLGIVRRIADRVDVERGDGEIEIAVHCSFVPELPGG